MLNESLTIKSVTLDNRVVLQPMEGCDCREDGGPTELTKRKYMRAARSGAGLVWMEATAVCPEGRTNTRQMMLTEATLPEYKAMLSEMRRAAYEECGVRQKYVIQLTHSGRQSIRQMIAYRNAVYEARRPMTDADIVTDEYLDTLPALYRRTAELACLAGFDGVDVKSCHGYLFQELLSAYTREGRYGGSLENRARLYLDCVRAVREILPDGVLLTGRLSVSDMVPYPNGFATTEDGRLDLGESDALISQLCRAGLDVLNVTVGNPYYNPHVNRPYRKGAYQPPEPAAEGLFRFEYIEEHIKKKFPHLYLVASGLSYYREDLFLQSERILREGKGDLVGYGRGWLAYPELYRDYKNGEFVPRRCCVACSRCTELMRAGRESGCAVFDEYYRELYKEIKK